MNILVLADHEAKSIYDYYEPGKLRGIDLIISCGDLSAAYLAFFATMCHAPVLYIKGNHDKRLIENTPSGDARASAPAAVQSLAEQGVRYPRDPCAGL